MIRVIKFSVLLLCLIQRLWAYQLPIPQLKAFRKGFELTLPHEDGITTVNFCGNSATDLRPAFNYQNEGTGFYPFTLDDENKLWTHRNYVVELKVGSVLKYWICLKKGGKTFEKFFISKIIKIDEETIPKTLSLSKAPPYKIPNPSLKVYRKGIELSIPHADGMDLVRFAVDTTLSSDNSKGGRYWHPFTFSATNTFWVYRNDEIQQKVGDTFRYAITVRIHGIEYLRYFCSAILKVQQETILNEPATSGLFEESPYKIPYPNITVYRKGYQISIPDEVGMELVYCVAELKSAFGSLYVDTRWYEFNLSYKDGFWAYTSVDVEAKMGDIFAFWFVVSKNGKRYQKKHYHPVSKIYEQTTTNGYQITQYTIPSPNIKVYRNSLEISLPDEDGIESVHCFSDLTSDAATRWHTCTLHNETSLWTYTLDIEVKVGSIFRVWFVVTKDGNKYYKTHTFSISEFIEETTARESATSDMLEISEYTVPDPNISVYRKGWEISIPYEDGIELVYGTMDITPAAGYADNDLLWCEFALSYIDGLLMYRNVDIEAKVGDVFNFKIVVTKNGKRFDKEHIFIILNINEETTPSEYVVRSDYIIPNPNFRNDGKSLEVYLPHKDGIEEVFCSVELISAVGFSNSVLRWHKCSLSTEMSIWTYKFDIESKVGDIFRSWFSVKKNGNQYMHVYSIIVSEIYDETTASESIIHGLSEAFGYIIPNPIIRAFRTGIEISIPHENGIEAAIFSAELNSVIIDNASNVIFQPDVNGRWTYRSAYVEIALGDTVHYNLMVSKNGLVYTKDNLVHTIQNYDEDTNASEPEEMSL